MTNYVAGPGQPATGLTINDGDTLTVLAGGSASGDLVDPGGLEIVSGTAFSEAVAGSVLVSSGGQVQQLTASLTVETGGTLTLGHVVNGASLTVFGTISLTTISAATILSTNGQTFVTPTSATIMAGGAAYGTLIGSGADVAVDGTLHGGTLGSGGLLDVFGTALGLTVQAGGELSVALGSVSGTTLSGGTETLLGTEGNTSPLASGTQVLSGGLVRVDNGGSDTGTMIGAGGSEVVGSGSLAQAPTIAGGTLELAAGAEFDGATFAGAGGELLVDGTAAPGGNIGGFAAGDRVVFGALPADPSASLAVTGNTVTLTADGMTEALTILGASTLPLTLGTDAATGGEAIGVACFCAGTAILTADGERAVETIAPGDVVITADGRAEPVLWVGRRSYGGRFLAGQRHLLPIRIRAGALGRRLPRRDLLVSPCHAMLLGGVLVPAGALVDGRRITVERDCAEVSYVHIELARHEVILAEGAASETFLDDGSRGLFQAAEGVAGSADVYCAPRRADGFEIEAIRRGLAA